MINIKDMEKRVLEMAILIKGKFPEMDEKECGCMAKKLYIDTLMRISEK